MNKKKHVLSLPAGWVVSEEIQIHGRNVLKGTELSVKGEPGRFRFIKHVKTETKEWVDVVGGKKGYKTFRSFDISRIKTVHYKNKTRENKKA